MALFEEARRTPTFGTLGAELDAIRRGTKPISFFASDREAIEDGAELIPIMKAAFARGLAVTTAPRGEAVDVFVHPADNAGRIAPLQALLARSPWTFELEARLGVQLGYTAKQRAAWMAAEHHAYPAYGCLTMYGSIAEGALPPGDERWWREPGRVVAKGGFAQQRRRGRVLYRAGLSPSYARKLDGKGAVWLTSAARHASFEHARCTGYERLTAQGWREPPTA